MESNTNPYLKAQRTKDIQTYLNEHGYTDDTGSALAVDGSAGPKTWQAMQKFNVHQNQMNTPNPETRDMQVLLSNSGYKNADGTPLKIDGIHGPNTDNAINKFENDFLGQVVPNYTPKTIQTNVFPKVPNLSKVNAVPSTSTNANYAPNAGGTTTSQPASFNATSTLFAPTTPKPLNATSTIFAPTPTKTFNATSTLFAPTSAQPSNSATQASVNSGNTNAANSNSAATGTGATVSSGKQLVDLYRQYNEAKNYTDRLQKQADDYQKQAESNAMKLPDMAQKVRFGMAKQEEYDALATQVQVLRSQADRSRKLAENYQIDRDNYRKGMDKILADQVPAPQKESALFDSPEECAKDFAERAMPLTDKSNNEYCAVMTTVQVPVLENGQWTTKTKYRYGGILAGNHGDVIINAIAGLAKTDGKKYLLHTHPNSIYTNYQNSGQTFVDHPDDFSQPGDGDIPTTLGRNGIVQDFKSLGLPVSGYDGIYLASPTGRLFYYDGTGDITKKTDRDVTNGMILPQAKVQWDTTTNTYKTGYWTLDVNGNYTFIPTP